MSGSDKADRHQAEERDRGVGQSLRVLVVDDNLDAARSLAMVLRLYRHDVQVAHDGLTALQMAQAHRPEVVLLDIGMPGMNGLRVAQHLRQQEGMEKVRLIAITGYGRESDRQRCQQAGFDCHLIKPVDPSQLQELLANLGNPSDLA